MYKLRHPLSQAVYGRDAEGLVRVEKDGLWGQFTFNGQWVAGELRTADPEMCRWVASQGEIPASTSRDRVSAVRALGADKVLASTRKEPS